MAARPAKLQTIEFEGTRVFVVRPMRQLLGALEAARRLKGTSERMSLIIGQQGLGKTLGARYFATQHDDTAYLQVPPAPMLTPRRLLGLIEGALGMSVGARRTLHDTGLGVIDRLRRYPRLLLFDNANRIRRYDYIDVLRYIHDEAGARMAFISVPQLEHIFRQYPEFSGRCQIIRRMDPPEPAELAQMFPGISPAALDAMYKVTAGGIRELMVLRYYFAEQGIAPRDWTVEDVNDIASRFTLRAA